MLIYLKGTTYLIDCIGYLIHSVGQIYEHALQQYQVTRMYQEVMDVQYSMSPPLLARIKIVDKMYASQMAKSDRASCLLA